MAKMEAGNVRRREDALRAAGLRLVRVWLPETRNAGFAAECARQSRLIRETEASATGTDDEAWFETSDKAGWTA